MSDLSKGFDDLLHFTYIWTTENLCFPCDVVSPTFTVKEMEMTRWRLWIHNDTSEFVELYISRREDNGPKSMEIKFEISFLGINGLPLTKMVETKKFEKGDFFEYDKFAKRDEVCFGRRAELMPKDALTVRCRMWRTGTGVWRWRHDSCFARTRLRPDRRSFVWVIRKFKDLQRGQERELILSTALTDQLVLKLFLTEKDDKEYLSIAIQNCCQFSIVKISILDYEGRVVHSEKKTYSQSHADDYLFENFFEKGKLLEDRKSLLPNDVLTLRCQIEMLPDIIFSQIEIYRHRDSSLTDSGEILCCPEDEASNPPSSFKKDMKSFVQAGTLSDVSLRTDSGSFNAHKCILSARSPVFEAMFDEEMAEETSKRVDIPDLEADVMAELLSYIYLDTVGELEWQSAIDIYRAANKYKLPDLKRRCATFLKSNLSSSNVCSVLNVALTHHDKELRNAAQHFVSQIGAGFFVSDTWRSFRKENSKFALDIMEQMLFNTMEI